MKSFIMIQIVISILSMALFASEDVTRKRISLNKPLVINDIWLDVNRMNGIFRNNGIWHHDAVSTDWGLEWPKGSGLSPMFAAGQWIGARVEGEVRVAGVQHSATEFQPGMILEPFVADNPSDAKYRWYSIEYGGIGDWLSWPVDQGAPVDDGGAPLLIGDRTLFCVWNDLTDHGEFGTPPLSVEVRQTVFAFNRADALGDMQIIKWLLVNKSGLDWDSTYFSIFTDPDVGAAMDDLVGCDTTLDLGFCYNATNNDQNYGAAPPAIGVDLLQGPLIDTPGSNVVLPDGTILAGKKILGMTGFVFYNNDDTPYGNPHTGDDVWNYFRGRWRDGSRITEGERGTNPANPTTKLMFSGDPETVAGWLDSDEADRRFLMISGPFAMEAWNDENGNNQPDLGEPGVQEIVACVMVARALNNLNSVSRLKQIDADAQSAYDVITPTAQPSNSTNVPTTFNLNQNYPNPFNNATMITYQLSRTSPVELIVYNLLGQKVATLVSHRQQAGVYHVNWDAGNMSSGIYYYQLQAGEYQDMKKMLLIR